MEKTKQLTLLLAVILTAFFAGSASANMLINGDFEDWDEGETYPADWDWIGSGGMFDRVTTAPDVIDGISPRMLRDGDGSGVPRIAQTIATTNGTEYTLTFDLRRADGYSTNSRDTMRVIVEDLINGNTKLVDQTYYTTDEDVHEKTINFTAASTSTRVSFGQFTKDGSGAAGLIDNIVLTPEPATLAVLGVGSIGMLIRRRRR